MILALSHLLPEEHEALWVVRSADTNPFIYVSSRVEYLRAGRGARERGERRKIVALVISAQAFPPPLSRVHSHLPIKKLANVLDIHHASLDRVNLAHIVLWIGRHVNRELQNSPIARGGNVEVTLGRCEWGGGWVELRGGEREGIFVRMPMLNPFRTSASKPTFNFKFRRQWAQ